MIFRYKSPVGLMQIYYQTTVGRYALQIGDIIYGHYHSAQAAADDVYVHVTGCYDWDRMDGKITNAPTDLSEWERMPLR